ncbi:MAG: hypothetical protein KDB02_15380, partial [Acidimicrobiales bacterium]|nr:hypothetical protein [Acidimicrobiales bacterium]
PDMLDDLIAAFPSAVTVVVADEMEGTRTSIHCEPDEIRLDDIGLAFTPQRVDTEALEDLGRTIAVSEADEGEVDDDDYREGFDLDDSDDLDAVDTEDGVTPVEAEAEAAGPPEYDVLVRLLGDIRIEGATKTVHPKATSVIAYLALNRSVTSERLEEACWFGSNGTSHRKRLRETMSICR